MLTKKNIRKEEKWMPYIIIIIFVLALAFLISLIVSLSSEERLKFDPEEDVIELTCEDQFGNEPLLVSDYFLKKCDLNNNNRLDEEEKNIPYKFRPKTPCEKCVDEKEEYKNLYHIVNDFDLNPECNKKCECEKYRLREGWADSYYCIEAREKTPCEIEDKKYIEEEKISVQAIPQFCFEDAKCNIITVCSGDCAISTCNNFTLSDNYKNDERCKEKKIYEKICRRKTISDYSCGDLNKALHLNKCIVMPIENKWYHLSLPCYSREQIYDIAIEKGCK